MKIVLSRRMRAFIAKWGGLVLAVILILPISILGVIYLYANSRVENTANWVTQAISISSIDGVGLAPETTSVVVYRLTLAVDNSTADAAQIRITNAKLMLDGTVFAINGSADWLGRVEKESVLNFEGEFAIDMNNALDLWDRPLTMVITGTVTANVRCAFVTKEETRPVNIIVEEVILPAPAEVPQAIPFEEAPPQPAA